MKELTIEEKAQRYDEALKVAKGLYAKDAPDSLHLERMFPVLKESEESGDEKIKVAAIEFVRQNKSFNYYLGISKEEVIDWIEKQGEKKPIWHNEDEEPQKDSLILLIMQSETPIVAKIIEPNHTFNHGERWAYIDDLLEKQDEKKPTDLPKGEDYGIDGLYAAIDILKKTLGKVDGYQSDDSILEHKCAISAVKKLYEQKPWSEEDEKLLALSLNNLTELKDRFGEEYGRTGDCIEWLKSLKDRYTWKPTGEQMGIIAQSVAVLKVSGHDELGDRLGDISEQLNKLKG